MSEERPIQSVETSEERRVRLGRDREEIRAYREKELRRELTSGHLIDEAFSADELEDADLEIWEKVRDGTITQDEFNAYNQEFLRLGGNWGASVNFSRRRFVEFVRNLAGGIFAKRQLEEEIKREKNQ